MCKHGTDVYVKLNHARPTSGRTTVPVDACIADEIQMLNDKGVFTYGCCCGHFERKPVCLVDISSKQLLEYMGYKLREVSERHTKQGIYDILLKTGWDKR